VTDPRTSLVAGLRERIARFRGTGDVQALLSFDARLEVRALIGPNERVGTEATYIAGLAYWLRYRAGGPAEELVPALRLLAAVQDAGEGYEMPGAVRLVLECRDGR
jgi:hypothetical protein